MPETVPEIFKLLLSEWEAEFGLDCVANTLSMLVVQREGTPEDELITLCSGTPGPVLTSDGGGIGCANDGRGWHLISDSIPCPCPPLSLGQLQLAHGEGGTPSQIPYRGGLSNTRGGVKLQ